MAPIEFPSWLKNTYAYGLGLGQAPNFWVKNLDLEKNRGLKNFRVKNFRVKKFQVLLPVTPKILSQTHGHKESENTGCRNERAVFPHTIPKTVVKSNKHRNSNQTAYTIYNDIDPGLKFILFLSIISVGVTLINFVVGMPTALPTP